MRSVATISRASPRSNVSRTLPRRNNGRPGISNWSTTAATLFPSPSPLLARACGRWRAQAQAAERLVDVRGVVTRVEDGLDLLRRQASAHLVVLKEQVAHMGARIPRRVPGTLH